MARRSKAENEAQPLQSALALPPPPKHLSKEAAAVWRAVTASKPADWFDAGAQILLSAYCESAVHEKALARKVAGLRRASKWDELEKFEKRHALVERSLATLATKLRLSVQANLEWHARKIAAKGVGATPAQGSQKPQRSSLIGGEAVWGEQAQPSTKPN